MAEFRFIKQNRLNRRKSECRFCDHLNCPKLKKGRRKDLKMDRRTRTDHLHKLEAERLISAAVASYVENQLEC